jgi:diketogulonate reductase-like aldo/keto reductase
MGDGMARACEASLAWLGTDHLDLYLLHWRDPDTDLTAVVAGFENLRATSKIRAWGVSNFKVSDMEDLPVFHKAIAARPIRPLTTSATAALNMTYCPGANSTACR